MGKQWELETWVENIWMDKPENLEPPYSPEPSMLAASFLFIKKSSVTLWRLCNTSPVEGELQDDALPP